MEGVTPSTTPVAPGGPNPAYPVMLELAQRAPDFRAMAAKIARLAMERYGRTDLTPLERMEFKAVVDAEMVAERRRFEAMIRGAMARESTKQFMPAPPPARDLYGLVADGQEIVDVGSGNCMRLFADSGRLKITAVDPDVGHVHVTVKKKAKEVEIEDVCDQVVTSFNALVQIPEGPVKACILEQDGLHVIPDHQELIEMGCAVRLEDKVHCFTPQVVYQDYPMEMPGRKLGGYVLAPTFKPREVVLDMPDFVAGPVMTSEYRPHIDCSPAPPVNMNWDDLGWKWDGVPFEIEVQGGGCTATRRDGSYVEGSVVGSMPDCSLHVEVVRDVMVLLRIECYRGFVPPHCGDVLRYFCSRVKMKWSGRRLVPPPKLDLAVGPKLEGEPYPVDGIISREDQRDYYVKPAWTLDLYPADVAGLSSRLADSGRVLQVDCVHQGLWEYEVERREEVCSLKALRRRIDKDRATPAASVDYLLSLPTLKEYVAYTGRMPDVVRLVSHFLEV